MGKDLFDCIVTPTPKEYRAENVIDEIFGMPKLIIGKKPWLFPQKEVLINDAIVNYNNEVIVVKSFYATMIKYQKYYKKHNDDFYDFWARKYGEQVIKELYSIYDKSVHVINYLYDLRVKPDISFKKNVMAQLKMKDSLFYKKIYSIYKMLYYNSTKSSVRNNITHNFSELFYRCVPKYGDDKTIRWYMQEPISFYEYKEMIDSICNLLCENKKLIIEKLTEIYPPEGSKEFEQKIREDVSKLLGCDLDVQ